ncbi:MAG TPA: folylpolyglutamate synthase/dihydrofolate synthase family protein [Blastocatellia bacterium]|nr:folylpolyglutamate synthase/dihydrofolate synthase family protein [Blastocatellia bacterium]
MRVLKTLGFSSRPSTLQTMDYSQSLTYLYSLGHEVLAAKYRLETIRLLLNRLGDPDRSFKSVLVAGTNGKGSVAAMIESVAREAGHRTALYTSPHLVRIQERIKVAGVDVSESEFAHLATEVREASEALVQENSLETVPTFFEQVTAAALLHFARNEVELAVLEVGLGGRLDATNSVDRILSVVTSIDLDHQETLGSTITEIAGEKAAIIVPGARAVIGRQRHQAAGDVLMRRCLEVNVLPVFANEPAALSASDYGRLTFDYESTRSSYSRIMLGLRGRHQAENAAAAIEACEALDELGFNIRREAVVRGLRDVSWEGRLEWNEGSPAMLLDGAHNASGAQSLREFLVEFWDGPLTLVFGSMADKDIDAMAAALFDLATTVVLTRVRDRRAAAGPQLGKPALLRPTGVIFTETVRQALSWARGVTPREGLMVVAGSLHLVGEVKRLIEEEDSQGAAV